MRRDKQKATVLEHLKKFGSLTTLEAVTQLGIMCPAKRVEELRKEGVPIVTTYMKSANGTRYGVYRLAEEV